MESLDEFNLSNHIRLMARIEARKVVLGMLEEIRVETANQEKAALERKITPKCSGVDTPDSGEKGGEE